MGVSTESDKHLKHAIRIDPNAEEYFSQTLSQDSSGVAAASYVFIFVFVSFRFSLLSSRYL